MKCTNCGANIDYKTTRCPLCHGDIDAADCPSLYPEFAHLPPRRKSILTNRKFALIKLLCITVVAAIALCCNYSFMRTCLWSLPLVGALFTAWLIFFHSINTRFGLGNRMFLLLLALVGDVYLVGYFIGDITFATCSLLPMAFLLISGSMLGCCLAVDTRKYLFVSIFFGLLNFIPMIVVLSLSLACSAFSIFTAVIGGLCVLVSMIACGKNLPHYLRTFFHF